MGLRTGISLVLAGWCACAALAACAPSRSFEAADADSRIRAIQHAARTGDESTIPELIAVLDSDDPASRLFAIRTLERITGHTHGYDHAAPEYERRPAVDRWVSWYQRHSGAAADLLADDDAHTTTADHADQPSNAERP